MTPAKGSRSAALMHHFLGSSGAHKTKFWAFIYSQVIEILSGTQLFYKIYDLDIEKDLKGKSLRYRKKVEGRRMTVVIYELTPQF
jgi:hypothetical protein